MRIAVELVPKTYEHLQEELTFIRQALPAVDTINLPDLMRYDIRSWDACRPVRDILPHSSPIPHFRAIDINLKKPLPFAARLLEMGVKEVIVVTGDPPTDMSKRVYPTSCIDAIKKFKRELPEIQVYAGLDPYRSSLRSELEYLERKQEAGAAGFFTQPYFDLRLMDVFQEMFEQSECHNMPIFWGVTSVVGVRSRRYWETRNRAIFPRGFEPTLQWNRDFVVKALDWVRERDSNIYLMPIKVGIAEYLDGLL